LPAEGFDLFDDRRRRRSVEAFRSRRAIHQTSSAFGWTCLGKVESSSEGKRSI
jgi:hypothetical protein